MPTPASIPALAALSGSIIGGLTSFATTWLAQHSDFRKQRFIKDRATLEALFTEFIDKASVLYAEAFTHDKPLPTEIARLYASINKMRLLTSKSIVDHAEEVMRQLVQTYLSPNRAFNDMPELMKERALDPLKNFSNVCREELRRLGSF